MSEGDLDRGNGVIGIQSDPLGVVFYDLSTMPG